MDSLKTSEPQDSSLHFLDYWRIIRIRKTVILSVFLLVAVTATIVTFILPPSYASTARIQVTRNAPDTTAMEAQANPMAYDPYFINNELLVMKSENVLGRVVTNLDLTHVWGKKYDRPDGTLTKIEAINILRGHIAITSVRNTLLIDVAAYSDNAEEAERLANAVAKAYQDYRDDVRKELSGGGLEAMDENFQEQQRRINEAKAEVERLRQQFNIIDTEANSTQINPSMDAAAATTVKIGLEQDKADYEKLSALLKSLKELSPDELRTVIPRTPQIPDNQLTELLTQLNNANVHLLTLKRDYETNNSIYINAQEVCRHLEDQIDEAVKGSMIALEQHVNFLKAAMDAREQTLASATANDIRRARETRPYYEAKQKVEELEAYKRIVQMKIQAATLDRSIPQTAAVSIVDPARADMTPVSPKKGLNITLGIVIGLLVGIGLAFFIEYLDTSVKTIDDVERALQAPVLGVIPQNVGILLKEGAESPHAEAYRVLRTNLLFSRKDEKLNTVCIISAGAGEGKSTTILNLATVFAQSGQRVLLVDSDLRRPTLHKILGLTNDLGLTNCLLKQNSLEEVVQRTNIPMLDLMPSGKLPSSSLSILSSAQMRELITNLKRRYDFVFFDSPPIMGVSDASILASEVDMTIQVIQYRRYPQPMNIRAKQMVEKVGGNMIGIVLNNINMSQDESYYYYSGYYHGSYYTRDEDQLTEPATDKPAIEGEKPSEIKQKY